jgi:hypothetical protein
LAGSGIRSLRFLQELKKGKIKQLFWIFIFDNVLFKSNEICISCSPFLFDSNNSFAWKWVIIMPAV